MSGKNHKKLRRLGLDRKTKNISLNHLDQSPDGGLFLLTREQLFDVLELLHLKCVRMENDGWENLVRDTVGRFKEKRGKGTESLIDRILSFRPGYHDRTEYPVVPISVFHEEGTEKVFYSFTSYPEFWKLSKTFSLTRRNGNGKKVHVLSSNYQPDSSQSYAGVTPFNTFQLELDLEFLEDLLPKSRAELDDLISMGINDEMFSPLNEQELRPFLEMKEKQPDVWKRTYTDTLMVIKTHKGTFYQPQKTRIAWSQCAVSTPIRFSKEGFAMVPSYRQQSLLDLFGN